MNMVVRKSGQELPSPALAQVSQTLPNAETSYLPRSPGTLAKALDLSQGPLSKGFIVQGSLDFAVLDNTALKGQLRGHKGKGQASQPCRSLAVSPGLSSLRSQALVSFEK